MIKLLVILILIFGVFSYFNINIGYGLGGDSAAKIFGNLSVFKKTASTVASISKLTRENLNLEGENRKLLSRIAELENMELENIFLKKVLKIAKEKEYRFIIGGIYTWTLGPDGYSVLLNKGSTDGVSKDDVVITDEKILIGLISESNNNFSKILLVADPEFKATGKIIGSNTTGIIVGASRLGLRFNLIVQDDQIKEGDIVVTDGNDIFPDSLIIGRVKKVELSESQVFKNVLVEPEFNNIPIKKVIILKND